MDPRTTVVYMQTERMHVVTVVGVNINTAADPPSAKPGHFPVSSCMTFSVNLDPALIKPS